MFDVFSSAGRDWAALVEGRDSASVLAPQVVARGGVRPLRIANGVQIVPDAGIDVVPEVICVPEMAVVEAMVANDALLFMAAEESENRTIIRSLREIGLEDAAQVI